MHRGLKTASLKGGAAASSIFRTQAASLYNTQAYVRSNSQRGPTAKSSPPRPRRPNSRGSSPYRPNVRTAPVTNTTSSRSSTTAEEVHPTDLTSEQPPSQTQRQA